MQTVHNPDRFMADLRQILSQGRKRIGLLLGAGAPMSIRINADRKLDAGGAPLIPGVDALTASAIDNLQGKEKDAAQAIIGSLGAAANVELILSRVRLLQQAAGTDVIHGLDSEGYAALGASICKAIGEVVAVRLPNERCAYHELVAWINGTQRPHPIEIFTTNYDLLLEEAFESAKAPYFDGFAGSRMPFFDPVTVSSDDLPSRWSRIWKLHGSLGWKADHNGVVRVGGYECNQLVYPDHLKYDLTQKQPYAALFERLRIFLAQPDTVLLAAGFSFRDAHICAVLDEALAANANASVFTFQYLDLSSERAACALALDHPNLSVYAADGAVISAVPGEWRPGDPPKNWSEIRASFWGPKATGDNAFLLGDFPTFCRFCALSHSPDLARELPPLAGQP